MAATTDTTMISQRVNEDGSSLDEGVNDEGSLIGASGCPLGDKIATDFGGVGKLMSEAGEDSDSYNSRR